MKRFSRACIALVMGSFSLPAVCAATGQTCIREGGADPVSIRVIDSDQSNFAPVAQRIKWMGNRYGAFAISTSTGWSGWANNAPTRRSAERTALRMCRERGRGVSDCKIKISFYNQCGSVVGGANHSGYGTAGDLNVARELATRRCEALGPECKVFWEGCSYPAHMK